MMISPGCSTDFFATVHLHGITVQTRRYPIKPEIRQDRQNCLAAELLSRIYPDSGSLRENGADD
jgi:hypothetical protein